MALTKARLLKHDFPIHGFADSVMIFYTTELVLNIFLGYVSSCDVTEHTMWASDYTTKLFSNYFTGYVIDFYVCNNFGLNGIYNVPMAAAVVWDRLPEGTQKPLLGLGSPSLQCRH